MRKWLIVLSALAALALLAAPLALARLHKREVGVGSWTTGRGVVSEGNGYARPLPADSSRRPAGRPQ